MRLLRSTVRSKLKSSTMVDLRRGLFTEANIEMAVETAIADLDRAFLATRYDAGTTAVLALDCGGRVMIASIGDSVAMMCGVKAPTGPEINGSQLFEKAATNILSQAHSPDRPDEQLRITNAGGYVKIGSGGE